MEIATTLGAVAGGLTAIFLGPDLLAGIFGVLLLYVAFSTRRKSTSDELVGQTGQFDTRYLDP